MMRQIRPLHIAHHRREMHSAFPPTAHIPANILRALLAIVAHAETVGTSSGGGDVADLLGGGVGVVGWEDVFGV